MKNIALVLSIFLLIFTAFQAVANDEDYERMPGYFDFGSFDEYSDRETSVEVYIKEPLLSLVRIATRHEEPELSELLSRIKLITVRTFSVDKRDEDSIGQRVTRMGEKLDREGWEKIVRVRGIDEQVFIYMKMTGETIDGLVVIAVEYGDEAAFVNIVGDITPESLELLYGRFSIPELDSIDVRHERRTKGRRR
jgi:hypothetical protein